jgi:hypothetical protein
MRRSLGAVEIVRVVMRRGGGHEHAAVWMHVCTDAQSLTQTAHSTKVWRGHDNHEDLDR